MAEKPKQREDDELPDDEDEDLDPNLAGQVDEDEEEDLDEKPSPAQARIEARLNKASEDSAEAKVLARMMADPDFNAVAQAKRSGKKFKIVAVEPDDGTRQRADREAIPEPEDLDELGNKDLVQYMERRLGNKFEEILERGLKPVTSVLAQHQQREQEREAESIKREVQVLRKKNPNLDLYAAEMLTISDRHPDLRPAQLLILAKAKLGELRTEKEERNLASEKPTHHAAGRSRERKKAPLPPGKAGFRQALADAARRVDLNAIMSGEEQPSEDQDYDDD